MWTLQCKVTMFGVALLNVEELLSIGITVIVFLNLLLFAEKNYPWVFIAEVLHRECSLDRE